MGKNTTGGKKGRGKKNAPKASKELIYKVEGESNYGKITAVNGNGRYKILNIDGITRTGILRGAMRKGKQRCTRIVLGDLVLTTPWEFQDEKCSIIHKYESDDCKKLIKSKEIPDNFLQDDVTTNECDFNPFDISSSDDSDDEKDDSSDEKQDIPNELLHDKSINLDDI
jgi:translation initiation factor 1A